MSKLPGVITANVHIGNSDVVLEFLFHDSTEVLNLIASVKKSEEVERIAWSEPVYVVPGSFELEPYIKKLVQ